MSGHVTDWQSIPVLLLVEVSHYVPVYLSIHTHSQSGSGSHISKTDEESALNQILQKTAK